MSSEALADTLNGLVAAGTLALAGVTYLMARATTRTAVDAASPRVIVTWLDIDVKPLNWSVAANVSVTSIEPGLTWSLAQHGTDRIGLRCAGHLRNEGSVTALFQFRHGADVSVAYVTFMANSSLGGPRIPLSLTEQEGWYLLAPGAEVNFGLTWWQTANAWAKAYSTQLRRDDSLTKWPLNSVKLLIRGATGESLDVCTLTYGRHVLVPHPQEDGWVIAVVDKMADTPGTALKGATRISPMRRTYPGLAARLRHLRKA